jgi:TolB-like protein
MLSVRRLRDRKIVQWVGTYLAGAWLFYQVVSLVGTNFDWPSVVLRVLTVLLGVGFLVALVLAWYHGERGAQRVSAVELAMLAALLVLAGVGVAGVRSRSAPEAAGTPPAVPTAQPAQQEPERGSIAVLPFADLSPAGDQEYFSDGLTEEILNLLAQLPGLRVAARTSSFAFRGDDVGVDSIARALRVGHLLEGSVRRAGGRLRVTAQLVEARTGFHVWSRTYDREVSDVFAVQADIARSIATQMRLRVGADVMASRQEETTDPVAHALVLQAGHVFVADSDEQRAGALLREALARDPDYARARANLGIVYLQEAYEGDRQVDEAGRLAGAALARAFSRDPDLLAGHVLASMLGNVNWDWDRAERHSRRALELAPANFAAHGHLAFLLLRLGHTDQALDLMERAVRLDPLSPQAHTNIGLAYARAGRSDDAVRELRASIALDSNAVALGLLAMTLADAGEHGEALRVAHELREGSPDSWLGLGVLAYTRARAGDRDDAIRLTRELERHPRTTPFLVAQAYAALGMTDDMFAWLERAVANRDPYVTDLAVTPAFAAYRSDPRTLRLLRAMGLPEVPRPGARDG